ncbi:acyl-CoA dehydrogenase family protein [Bacillus licheniformis]|nr:acyl-CoA dehydrogenase family protein [Bacillus licheniformis]
MTNGCPRLQYITAHIGQCPRTKTKSIGKPGKGFKQFLNTLDGGRISIAALAVGIAQGAFEAALTYARERNNSADRSLISRRFSSSLPTWPWKLSSPAIWC